MDWAKELASNRKPILHATNVVGKAVRFFSGEEGDRYISPVNAQPVAGPVLELDTKHTFVLSKREDFTVLTEEEYRFFLIAQSALSHGIKESIKLAASMKNVSQQCAVKLVRSILAAQINAIK